MTERASAPARNDLNGPSKVGRIIALIITLALTVLAFGGIVGFTKAWIDRGTMPSPRGLLTYATFYVAAMLFGWLSWRLLVHLRQPGGSRYERRYTRMWVTLLALGFVAGILLGMANGSSGEVSSLLANGPVDPLLAVATAATLSLVLIFSLVLYHRTIDDHEQQAYLWANSISFYFVLIATPVAWLLARGGIIPPIGIGTAMLILLAATVINFIVWMRLKYR